MMKDTVIEDAALRTPTTHDTQHGPDDSSSSMTYVDILIMMTNHRLNTKDEYGFHRFSKSFYSSREKVSTLLMFYAGMKIT